MAKFQVPRQYQQTALLVGIILALVMRGIFIAVGAAAIQNFSWIFYLFGAFLVYTAVKLATQGESHDDDFEENRLLKWVERRFPATKEWNGVHLTARLDGKRVITPMLIVIIALGTTDLLFALDSIPAIYGLTEEPYLVFTANVFALMGLRQLYFLIGGLLERLVYLSLGLSVILGFIGVKLILEALHENELPFINGGEHVPVPEIPIWVSLVFILGVLAVTTVASLLKVRRDPSAVSADAGGARRRRGIPPSRIPASRVPTSSPDTAGARSAARLPVCCSSGSLRQGRVSRGPELVGGRPRRSLRRLRRRAHRHGRRRPDDADDDPALRDPAARRGLERPRRVDGDEAGRRCGPPAARDRQQAAREVARDRLGAVGVPRRPRAASALGGGDETQDVVKTSLGVALLFAAGSMVAKALHRPAQARCSSGQRSRRARSSTSPSRASRSGRCPRCSSASSAASSSA